MSHTFISPKANREAQLMFDFLLISVKFFQTLDQFR